MKIKYIILAIILVVAALVVGLAFGLKPPAPDTSVPDNSDASVPVVSENDASLPDNSNSSVPDVSESSSATSDDQSAAVCTHEYTVVVIEPNCQNGGYTEHTCTKCGTSFRDTETPVNENNHNYVRGTTVAPTYETEGYTEYTCSRCNVVEKRDVVEKLVKPDESCTHEYVSVVIEPTCQNGGYTEHTCTKCGGTYRDAETPIEKNGHNFTAGRVVAPTYETEGYTEYVCSRCNAVEKRDIVEKLVKPIDNSYIDTIIAPTCTEKGYTERKYNADGRTERINVTDALGHNYVDTVLKPTCENDGYVERKCTRCGDSHRDVTEAIGHSYVQNKVVAPTCESGGYTEYKCTRCGHAYKDNKKSALGHDYISTVHPSTCTKDGYTEHKCSRCGKVYKDEETDATGHTKGALIRTVNNGCDSESYDICKCSVCGVEFKTNYQEQGHKWAVVKETIVSCGHTITDYKCSACSETKREDVDTGEHCKESDLVLDTIIPPSVVGEGCTYYKCTKCGMMYQRDVVPRLTEEHQHTMVVTETFGTITDTSNRVEHMECSTCGEYDAYYEYDIFGNRFSLDFANPRWVCVSSGAFEIRDERTGDIPLMSRPMVRDMDGYFGLSEFMIHWIGTDNKLYSIHWHDDDYDYTDANGVKHMVKCEEVGYGDIIYIRSDNSFYVINGTNGKVRYDSRNP